jgi:hypothetical protein
MPTTRATGLWRTSADHFEPDEDVDPKIQRQLRGQLEQIDYAAYAANRKMLNAAIGQADSAKFERLATAAALARTRWVAAALVASDGARAPTLAQIEELTQLRTAYEELAEAYGALRRMVERGYLAYVTPPPAAEAG